VRSTPEPPRTPFRGRGLRLDPDHLFENEVFGQPGAPYGRAPRQRAWWRSRRADLFLDDRRVVAAPRKLLRLLRSVCIGARRGATVRAESTSSPPRTRPRRQRP